MHENTTSTRSQCILSGRKGGTRPRWLLGKTSPGQPSSWHHHVAPLRARGYIACSTPFRTQYSRPAMSARARGGARGARGAEPWSISSRPQPCRTHSPCTRARPHSYRSLARSRNPLPPGLRARTFYGRPRLGTFRRSPAAAPPAAPPPSLLPLQARVNKQARGH